MKMRLLSIGAVLAVLAVGALAESPPPFVGTWKLNLAKSSYGATAPPKSLVVKHESVENGLRQIADGVDADGKPFHTEFTAKFDGKDYPVTGGPPGDAIALSRLDKYTIAWTWRNGRNVVSAGQAVYSRDGKRRVLRFTAAKGEKANITAVYERQ